MDVCLFVLLYMLWPIAFLTFYFVVNSDALLWLICGHSLSSVIFLSFFCMGNAMDIRFETCGILCYNNVTYHVIGILNLCNMNEVPKI